MMQQQQKSHEHVLCLPYKYNNKTIQPWTFVYISKIGCIGGNHICFIQRQHGSKNTLKA